MTVTPNEVIGWHQKQADHYSEIGGGNNALTLHHTGCASAVASLQARCAALEEALLPLAQMAPHFPRQAKYGNRPRSGPVYSCASHGLPDAEITVEALHAAAALLSADAPAEGVSSEV